MSENGTAVKPDAVRAANYLWTLLGRPEEFNNEETGSAWTIRMRDCMGEAELDLDGFKRFLEWVLDGNPLSAEYMRIARDPAATLYKNMPTLVRRYKAHAKAQEIIARKAKKDQNLPEYRKNSGKQGYLEKSDL